MKIIDKVSVLKASIQQHKKNRRTIGFVPTMGALHEGHLSLVQQAKAECDICVVSIFVNPTQFNNVEDLKAYPRNIDIDTRLLEKVGVDIVFTPTVSEVYPEPDNRQFDFGQLDKVMEGEHRPGHFNGVAQVVNRLFGMINPTKAYFGEKDFQQLAIIRAMVKQLSLDVEITAMPILREKSGLAMSSRNERLSEDEKQIATHIYRMLKKSKAEWFLKETIKDTINKVVKEINTFKPLSVEYFEIVDGNTLQSINNWDESDYIVGCIAVFCGNVRLIDNVVYKG